MCVFSIVRCLQACLLSHCAVLVGSFRDRTIFVIVFRLSNLLLYLGLCEAICVGCTCVIVLILSVFYLQVCVPLPCSVWVCKLALHCKVSNPIILYCTGQYTIQEGHTTHSFAIDVANLAGIPHLVTTRAQVCS